MSKKGYENLNYIILMREFYINLVERFSYVCQSPLVKKEFCKESTISETNQEQFLCLTK